RVVVRLKEQLDIIRPFGRDDGEELEFSYRHVPLHHEAQDLGVELEGLVLVVDEYASQRNLHRLLPSRLTCYLRTSPWRLSCGVRACLARARWRGRPGAASRTGGSAPATRRPPAGVRD